MSSSVVVESSSVVASAVVEIVVELVSVEVEGFGRGVRGTSNFMSPRSS